MKWQRRRVGMAAVLALGLAAALLGDLVYLRVKAVVAGVLLERAMQRTLDDGQRHLPWSWSDTAPLASLELPHLREKRVVLQGAGGGSLAFGVGHVDGSAAPNAPGHCVLAGHRDREFAVLEELREGDEIVLRTPGVVARYRVRELRVVDRNDVRVLEERGEPWLSLLTCYPFGAMLRGPERYLVGCERIEFTEAAPARLASSG